MTTFDLINNQPSPHSSIAMVQNTSNNALIVGGSSGVGQAVAALALTHLSNPHVIIVSSNPDRIKATLETLRKPNSSAKVDGIVQDLSNFDSSQADVESMLSAASSKFNGKINHIVWTAGDSGVFARPDDTNLDLAKAATVRLYSPLCLEKLALKHMAVDRRSSITLTSGVTVYRPFKGLGNRIAFAGSLRTGTMAMAVEVALICVNFVILGAIKTLALDEAMPNEEAKNAFAQKTLLKTIGDAEDAAEAYLASIRCAYMTGSRINCEGGSLLV